MIDGDVEPSGGRKGSELVPCKLDYTRIHPQPEVALQISNFSGYSRHGAVLLAEEVSRPELFYQRKVLEEMI